MGNELHDFLPDGPQPGPSWQRAGWPATGSDDELTQALDPLAMKAAIKSASTKAGPVLDEAAIESAAADSIRVMMLIRTYRVRGHLAADLDPLGLHHSDLPADLTPEFYGFSGEALDRRVFLGGYLGLQWATVREVVAILRRNYCGKVGLEYMHIADVEERRFLQDRMEGADKTIDFSDMGKKAILTAVIRGEQYEKFLGKKYVGTKRFGLDGGESMIPALEAVIKYGGQLGVKEIVYGMAHRGRLNVLANVMAKPYKVIFHEFSGGTANPEDVGGSGDVKYHLGTSADREFDGVKVHMSLMPNPSHLETVDPVVLGKVRAYQVLNDDIGPGRHKQVLPVLIHGDAAFAGQGIVWECFGFSGVKGYNTGGCIHFIINNQIGFTTSPQFSRGSPYPSDVAKGVQAPILHVNGDDPEAVTFVCKLAIDYRQKFGRDIVIDMWCYRRFGHNEGDEPSFTQPLMYQKIRQHPPVSELYAARLAQQGVIDSSFTDVVVNGFNAYLENEFEASKSYKANEADWFGGRWSGFNKPVDPETARRNVPTGIENKLLDSLGRTLTSVPEDLTIHKTLARVLDAKRDAFKSGTGFDWATGEALAFGSLLSEGYAVRLSGQDSGRGTFSQRHAVWVDQTNERKYVPLCTVPHGRFEVHDSPLSEYGVLGFEYGYASADPKTLVLWEAQFGDFANGAQIIIDQYIAASEAKWLRANGLVLLLPHGYEGQGPEHSSARMERFLQLCAQDNLQVCNISTPSNYFHALRRQMHRPFRKPLVIMTPKSLLRHPLAKSELEDFIGESHFRRIMADRTPPADEKVRKLVLCSGKVGYDLMEARDAAGLEDVSVLRLEQLYPFPGEPLAIRIARMPNLEEVVWCQEEPRNNGAWFFVESLIEEVLDQVGGPVKRPRYAGRAASASPATGLAKRHASEQGALVSSALGLSIRSEIRRQKRADPMSSEVKVPALGESVSEATIGQWLKQPGEAVAADEPIASLETDKVAIEVMAPTAGVMGAQLVKEGDTVLVGALITTIEAGSGTVAAAPAAAPAPAPVTAPAPAAESPAPSDAAVLSPAVRRAVLEYGIDPATIKGTGKDGRITKEDVVAAAQAKSAAPAPAVSAPAPAAVPAAGDRRQERVKMTRLRQTIARRLKEAQETAAMLTTFNDVDMSAVIGARDKFKEVFEKKHGVKLGFMSFFSKAACLALKDIPAVNAQIDGDEIVYNDYVDLSVAVSGPSGLVVPVVRNVDGLSFAGIEKSIADLGKRAREGTLTMDDMKGGTFTISNGGIFGGLMSTPIINPPQSAVLGLHRIEDRAVVRNGEIVIRPMMYLALSYDHRLIDGREAVTFLKTIKEAIEDPTRLLIDL